MRSERKNGQGVRRREAPLAAFPHREKQRRNIRVGAQTFFVLVCFSRIHDHSCRGCPFELGRPRIVLVAAETVRAKDTTANRRESHLDLYGIFKDDPEVRQRIALPPSSGTGASGAEASSSKPLATGKLQPDVCDSSIPFIRKLAFLSGCQRVLDDVFIRQWLQKNSIPMFTADFAYHDRANQVELAITQAAGTNFEGDMVVSIHQGVDLVDLHSIGIYSGVAEARQKIDCKKKRPDQAAGVARALY